MKALGKGSIASIIRVGLLIAWIVLWVAAAFLVLAAVGYGFVLVMIANGWMDPAILSGGDGQVRLGEGGGDFHLTYDNPGGATWPVVVPALLIAGVAVGGSLIIVWRLRKLFDSFSSGEPFRRENAQHLRVIWITMVVIELSRYALMGLAAVLLYQFQNENIAAVTLEVGGERFSAWMSIIVLIVLAEVFREGARLKEEQELTI
jgi:hypothetical protein